MNQKSIFNFSTLVVVAIGIGAALYGFLGFFGFTVGPATWIKPAVAFLTIFGALFGPVIGFLIGFIGHVITDLMSGGGVWWGWALGSGLIGLFSGFVYLSKGFNVKAGAYAKKHLYQIIIFGVLGCLVGMGEATIFDVLFMGEPLDKMLVQFWGAFLSNIVVVAVLGLPIILAILRVNKKSTNLTIEK